MCSSVNVGSTRAGINMDAVALMGRIIKETAAATADRDGLGSAPVMPVHPESSADFIARGGRIPAPLHRLKN